MRVSCPNQHASVTALVDGRKVFKIGQKNTRVSEESIINKVRDALKLVPSTKQAREALSALANTVLT